MMISGQPLLRRVLQDRAHHAAQGILGKKIVAEVIDSHGNQRTDVRDQMSEHRPAADSCPLSSDIWPLTSEVEASVARCLRTPPEAAKTSGLYIGLPNR